VKCRIVASSEYRTLYRSFLLRYRSHDFDIEVYEYPISWNLRKTNSISKSKTLISKSKLCFWYWINPYQLGGDSKGPSASANLRLGPASCVNCATSASPAHSYRTLYRILVFLFFNSCSSPDLQQAVRRQAGMLDATKFEADCLPLLSSSIKLVCVMQQSINLDLPLCCSPLPDADL
jgi:hypothetical protein